MLKNIILSLILLSTAFLIQNQQLFAEDKFQFMKDEAVKYRLEGLSAQQKGDLDSAMELFKKAISVDPAYAVAHNDLGIIYEEKEWPERAESEYLEAIKIDPNYLPPYSNLAFLYESLQRVDEAIEYWRKRASLGLENDPWTIKAKENLKRLNATLREPVVIDEETGLALEKKILRQAQDLSRTLAVKREMDHQQKQLEFSNKKFEGIELMNQGKFRPALDVFREARNINPTDQEINLLIEDAENKFIEKTVLQHVENGIEFFKNKDLSSARDQFKKVEKLLSTVLEQQKRDQEIAVTGR